MKDLKKYRVPIIGGIVGSVSAYISGTYWFTQCTVTTRLVPEVLIFSFIIGAIVTFAIDKVWK